MASAIRASLSSLARRWSSLRAARADAAAAREFWDAGAPGEPEDRYWGAQPLVRRGHLLDKRWVESYFRVIVARA